MPFLLDTESALTEMKYSVDVLKANGVIFSTRYGNGASI